MYIDAWLDGPTTPEDLKGNTPDDADLILVTHGHFDHSAGAPPLKKASKKADSKIVCNYEIGTHFNKNHGIDMNDIAGGNKGGTFEFGFC